MASDCVHEEKRGERLQALLAMQDLQPLNPQPNVTEPFTKRFGKPPEQLAEGAVSTCVAVDAPKGL